MLPAVLCSDAAKTAQFYADVVRVAFVVEQASGLTAAVAVHGFRLPLFDGDDRCSVRRLPRFPGAHPSHRFGWDSRDDRFSGHVLGDDGPRCHYRASANSDARKNSNVGPDPYILLNDNGRRMKDAALGRIFVVVERREHGVVADERVVTDPHAALILETATGVHENVFAQMQVPSKVGDEWRHRRNARVDLLAGYRSEQPTDLVRLPYIRVELLA